MFNGLLFVTTAAAIFALIQGVFIFADAQSLAQSSIRRRLTAIGVGDLTGDALRRRMLGDRASPWLASFLASRPMRWLDELIVTSGIGIPTERVLLGMTSALPLALVILRLTGISPLFCIAGSVFAAFALPPWILYLVQQRRMKRLVHQLPEAIDILVRSLRAGHPVATGVRLIAEELSDPIKTEFRLASDIMMYGLDIRSAFERMERRIPLEEFRYMAAAIRIQYETGGNLAEILASLSNVMRERLRLQMKVKALSAEARLSGKILALVPFAVTGFVSILNPDYFSETDKNPALAALLVGAVLLVGVGLVMLRRMARVKV